MRRAAWRLFSTGLPLVLSSLWVLSFGCGAAPQHAPRRPDGCGSSSGPGHDLELYLLVERNGAREPLCPGEPLSQDDTLWITVELELLAHVRMIYVAPDGQTGELVRQDQADMTRVAIFRAPEGLLAETRGEAQLFVVASREPLDTVDPTLATMLDLIRETGTLVDREGNLHPPTAEASAPLEILRLDATGDLHSDFDEHGVAMLGVALRARP
jgi:hypothetical protein